MYVYLFYIFLSTLVVGYILFLIYAKIRSPFWFHQPVFHTYEIIPKFNKEPYLKKTYLPRYGIFCNLKNVFLFSTNELPVHLMNNTIKLLQGYYVNNEVSLYHITDKKFLEQMYNGSVISLYFDELYFINDKNEFDKKIEHDCLYGSIVSKPQTITFRLYPHKNKKIHVIDFMCTHDTFKRKNIIRDLIQTHIYRHCHNDNTHDGCYILKKDVNMCPGVIPLCIYKTYTFVLEKTPLSKLPYQYKVVFFNETNLETWKAIYHKMMTHFEVSILPEWIDTISWLKNERYSIYVSLYKTKYSENIHGIYIFEDTYISWETEKNGRVFRLCASFIFEQMQNDTTHLLFFRGFLHSLKYINHEHKFGILEIPDITMNNLILKHWNQKYPFIHETATSLYSYNVIYPASPIPSSNVLFL